MSTDPEAETTQGEKAESQSQPKNGVAITERDFCTKSELRFQKHQSRNLSPPTIDWADGHDNLTWANGHDQEADRNVLHIQGQLLLRRSGDSQNKIMKLKNAFLLEGIKFDL